MTSTTDPAPLEPPADPDEVVLAEFLDAALERLPRGEPVDVRGLLGPAPHLVGQAERLLAAASAVWRGAAGIRDQALLLRSDVLALSAEEGALSAADREPLPDPFPGEFRVLRRLGAGGFGTVWLAEDRHLGRRVALKTVRLGGASAASTRGLALLREEARLLAGVRHLNVVQVHAWREAPALAGGAAAGHYLVLQYVPGGSLAERVRREGPLPWPAAARYVADVAEGLLQVHARGIVHRDVKPANLLWDPEADEALLTDFGISVRLAGARGAAGTPFYMPPEAFAGQVSPAQDVYGLAASLFWLLTGAVPFPGTTPERIVARARLGLPDPDGRCADVPRPLEQLLRLGLAAEPGRRPALADFAAALRGTLNQLLADSLALPAASAHPAAAVLRLTVSRQVDLDTFVPVATTRPEPERLVRDLKRVPPAPERVGLRTGDRVRVEVEADRPGFVTVFNVGPSGNLNRLYPVDPTGDAPAVEAGRPVRLLDVEVTPPAGRERLVAVWTREPARLGDDALRELAGEKAPPPGPYRATRDMVRVQESIGRLPPEDRQVVVLELEQHAPEEPEP
jgi:serine/threonine protein kinase